MIKVISYAQTHLPTGVFTHNYDRLHWWNTFSKIIKLFQGTNNEHLESMLFSFTRQIRTHFLKLKSWVDVVSESSFSYWHCRYFDQDLRVHHLFIASLTNFQQNTQYKWSTLKTSTNVSEKCSALLQWQAEKLLQIRQMGVNTVTFGSILVYSKSVRREIFSTVWEGTFAVLKACNLLLACVPVLGLVAHLERNPKPIYCRQYTYPSN